MSSQSPTLAFGEISLRERERAFLLGGTGSGKTTLEEMLVADFYNRYQSSRILILDSKPRFRAEYFTNGISAKRVFRHWKPGPTIPGSVLIREAAQLEDAWRLGARVVVAQAERSAQYPELVHVAETFYRAARHSRPQLLCVDETADYFHQNGSPIGGSDALVRIARSGRERGTAALYCSQRAKSIPSSIIEELTQLYLFALDGRSDLKRCIEMGAPEWIEPPEELLEFMLWTKRDRRNVYGPYKVTI
jgi:energy-coupling factor transporter ATP-binding protein EcfA2